MRVNAPCAYSKNNLVRIGVVGHAVKQEVEDAWRSKIRLPHRLYALRLSLQVTIGCPEVVITARPVHARDDRRALDLTTISEIQTLAPEPLPWFGKDDGRDVLGYVTRIDLS